MMKDSVRTADAGSVALRTRTGEIVASRTWQEEQSVVEVKGWVRALLRERGKLVPGSIRESKNIWTNTGREYLALLMSLQVGSTPFRQDRMAYIGVGIGS